MNKKARSVCINMIVMIDFGKESAIRSFKHLTGKIAMIMVSKIKPEG